MKVVSGFINKYRVLRLKLAGFVPFTSVNIVWHCLDKSNRSLLDIGCGPGYPVEFMSKRRNLFTVGVDAFLPALWGCKEKRSHSDYVRCDVRKLPFKRKSFDAVLCMEVIEHLYTEEGEKLLQQMEEIARREVVITTPVGPYVQAESDYADNPFQRHKAAYWPSEFKHRGYTVRGSGLRILHGRPGLQDKLPRVLQWLADIAYPLVGLITYFLPKLACYMVCTKRLDRGRN